MKMDQFDEWEKRRKRKKRGSHIVCEGLDAIKEITGRLCALRDGLVHCADLAHDGELFRVSQSVFIGNRVFVGLDPISELRCGRFSVSFKR